MWSGTPSEAGNNNINARIGAGSHLKTGVENSLCAGISRIGLAGPQEADFRNGTAHRSPFKILPLCRLNAQSADNQLFDNHRHTGIFQCTPPAMPEFQHLANRTSFQLRSCPRPKFRQHHWALIKCCQHTTSCLQSPATHLPHYFQLPPPTISGPCHRHQHPSSIFSTGVTPAPPPEYTTSGG